MSCRFYKYPDIIIYDDSAKAQALICGQLLSKAIEEKCVREKFAMLLVSQCISVMFKPYGKYRLENLHFC